MDLTEAGLELLTNQLKQLVESRVSSLSLDEISTLSKKIPVFNSLQEFREIRDKFLDKFNNPCEIPKSHSYSERLLSHAVDDCDLSQDTVKSFDSFYKKEIDRACRLRETVQTRCLLPEFNSKIQMQYSQFEDSITRYLFFCREGILRIQPKENSNFTINDLLLELTSKFIQKRRTAVLRSILLHIRRFPLTKNEKIFTNMFQLTQKSVKEDQQEPIVPTLPTNSKSVDNELYRHAKRLSMNPDLESYDGQLFLYYSNKRFVEAFNQLTYYELPRKKFEFPLYFVNPDLTELTQESILETSAHDVKLKKKFDDIFCLSLEQVASTINQYTNTYNEKVGNEPRSRPFKNQRKVTLIPSHKIASWLQLRFIYIKFLATAVLSHINYFEYIRCQLLSNKASIMRSTDFKSRHSKLFPEILEIYDKDGPFIFESAIEDYNKIVDNLIRVGSHYISMFEENAMTQHEGKCDTVDRAAIIEQLLQHELNFLNAKRMYIQPLIEALEHKKSDKFVNMIQTIIVSRPKFNFPIYKSYNSAYKLAISLIEKKAKIVRTLINIQILHERSLATNMGNTIPLFDRPSKIQTDVKYRLFDESIPISPFEVYESILDVSKFISIVPKVAQELGESADIKLVKYGDYLQLAIWDEIDELIGKIYDFGFFPFDRASLRFDFNLPDSVKSLFVSPFVNTLESTKNLIFKMKENRRLRFLLSARRFIHLTWKLQKLVCDTNLLQKSYYEQCDQLGITEKGVLMSSFKDCAKNEIIDLPSETYDLNLLDFALTEFESITLNFCSESSIKDIIFASDFSVLKRMIQFQNLQNTILEISIRYNRHLIDNNFFVSYFGLGTPSQGPFLTGVNVSPDDENNKDYNTIYFRQLIAYRIFYQSTAIYRDNQLAQENKNTFLLSIKAIKSRSRAILSAHVKQKNMNNQELLDLYVNEMIDAFSPFAYRIEIAKISNLERQLLLSNSFIDTFILGPDPPNCLINESGYFERFFYVPTWEECITMISMAPHTRQSIVLRNVLHFVESRFRILNLARYECSLSQRANSVFQSLYNQNFQFETPVFQKLFSEFKLLENSKQGEISSKYIIEKETFLYHRLEFSLLNSLEMFFISVNLMNQNNVKIPDIHLGEILQYLWVEMHQELDDDKWLITTSRYIPLWQQHFLYRCIETDRASIVTRINSNDSFLESSIVSLYSQQVNNDPIKLLPLSIDYLSLTICQLHIKFAYFLLLEGIPENEIDIRSSILRMNSDIYKRNSVNWDKVVVQQANEHLVPKDQAPSKEMEYISEPRLAQSIFDVVRNQVDLLLLSEQTKSIQSKIDSFNDYNKQVKKLIKSASKIDFSFDLGKSNYKHNLSSIGFPDKSLLNSTPNEYDLQFNRELKYSHKRLVEIFGESIKSSAVLLKEENILMFERQFFNDLCLYASSLLNNFSKESLVRLNETWKKYLSNISSSLNYTNEELGEVSVLDKFSVFKHQRQTECEESSMFNSNFLRLNNLLMQIKIEKHHHMRIEQQIEKKVREYYDSLINDIGVTMSKVKSQRETVKKKVFDHITEKVVKAKSVAMNLNNPEEVEKNIETQFGSKFDEKFISNIKSQSVNLRKEILLLRVFRCLNEIGISRYYSKQIQEVAEVKKTNNQQLWKEKLEFEFQEEINEEKLHEKHQQLSDIRIDIEKYKGQLENAKMSNIQLVHWKAKHSKTIEGLKREIDEFKGVGDININNLLKKLDAAQTELDELKEFGDQFESSLETTIITPIRKVERARTAVKKSRIQLAKNIESRNFDSLSFSINKNEEAMKRLQNENKELKTQNETLLKKVQEMEEQKNSKSEATRLLMEEALKSKRQNMRPKSKMGKRIVRPGIATPKAIQPPNRAVSRL